MKINCKEYQVKSKVVKCLEENDTIKHSKTCLEEQKLKEQYPSAKEIIWDTEKQNWSINFNELDKSHQTKAKKAQEKQEEVFGVEKRINRKKRIDKAIRDLLKLI